MAIDFNKYILSVGTHYISNTGHDENGKYHGGQAGDQGGEYTLRKWYPRPWSVVLRWPDQTVALKIAQNAIAAALNDKIGYDQYQRDTYWTALKNAGYNPTNVNVKCETDCTASTVANIKAVGYVLGVTVLKDLPLDTYSANMKARFVKAGFKALTDSKYLKSPDYLLLGDVLLYEGHHAAINVTCGKAVRSVWHPGDVVISEPAPVDRTLKNGMSGDDVKQMQLDLIRLGFNCGRWGADGDFGDATEMAVRDFQRSYGLTEDGVFGSATRAMLTKAIDSIDKVPADAEHVLIVGGDCYIRTGPSKENDIIKVVRDGSLIPFAGLVNEDNGWLYVEYKPNKFGWVSPKYGRLVS